MKNLILVIALILSINIYAQEEFEGKITFTIIYSELPEMYQGIEGFESMLPKETVTYIKGSRSCSQQDLATGGSQTLIFDKEKNTITMLMNMMGKRRQLNLVQKHTKQHSLRLKNLKLLTLKNIKL